MIFFAALTTVLLVSLLPSAHLSTIVQDKVSNDNIRPVLSRIQSVSDISLVVAMICRNEGVNFKSNLALWLPIAKYFVFVMDTRTNDDSEVIIGNILGKDNGNSAIKDTKTYHIEKNTFVGFGHARTLSMRVAWDHFPHATHILIADPDWRPVLDTIQLSSLLTHNVEVFRFTIYDRNGVTTRQIDWLLRNRPALAMRYHLHEVLDIGYYSYASIPWVIREVEQHGTWHTEVGHTNSFDAKRLLFDLSMLAADKQQYVNDPHVDYYLGITHNSYCQKLRQMQAAQGIGLELPGLIEANALNSGNTFHSNVTSFDVAVQTALIQTREGLQATLEYHYHQAVKYLTSRIVTKYDHEFPEQRWGAALSLSSLYDDPLWLSTYDYMRGNAWYQHCKDLSPDSYECYAFLVQHYLRQGVLTEALIEANALIRTEFIPRSMLNTVTDLECVMPTIVNQAFLSHIVSLQNAENMQAKGMSAYAKYTILLSLWVSQNNKCTKMQQTSAVLDANSIKAVEAAIQNDNKCIQGSESGKGIGSVPAIVLGNFNKQMCTSLETHIKTLNVSDLCMETDLIEYITTSGNAILVHPCGEAMQLQTKRNKLCRVCSGTFPILSEEYQVNTFGEFLGAASIVDIVHQMHQGNGIRVMLNHPHLTFRVLFAEYFNPKMVLNLISYASTRMNKQIDITVVSSDNEKLATLRNMLRTCVPENGVNTHIYNYSSLSLWLQDYRVALEKQAQVEKIELSFSGYPNDGPEAALPFFDYIEYNGGPNESEHLEAEFAGFQNVLAADGVLGITYFTRNMHVANILNTVRDAIIARNDITAPHVTHNDETLAKKLIQSYLNYQGFSSLAIDQTLVSFLAKAAVNNALRATGNVPRHPGVFYTQNELENLLQNWNFTAGAWLPSGYSQPYTELPHYAIKQFWSMGLPQESFLHNFLISFRRTVYAYKSPQSMMITTDNQQSINAFRPAGRARIGSLVKSKGVEDNFVIVDRMGTLAAAFSSSLDLAKLRGSLQFSTRYYSQGKLYNLSYAIQPSALPSMKLISSSPTLSQMLKTNIDFWEQDYADKLAKYGNHTGILETYTSAQIRADLIQCLDFLERIDMVSFLHNLGSESMTDVLRTRQAKYGALVAKHSFTLNQVNSTHFNENICAQSAEQGTKLSSLHANDYKSATCAAPIEVGNSEIIANLTRLNQHQQSELATIRARVEELTTLLQKVTAPTNASAQGGSEQNSKQRESEDLKTLPPSVGAPLAPAPIMHQLLANDKEHIDPAAKSLLGGGANNSHIIKKAPKIIARKVKEELYASHRRPACALDAQSWTEPSCLDPLTGRIRVSASVHLACISKTEFDIKQFVYIASKKPQVAKQIYSSVIPTLEKVIKILKDKIAILAVGPNPAPEDLCSHLSHAEMASISGYHNRVFLYSREPKPSWGTNMINPQAISYASVGMTGLYTRTHHFAVIDGLLKKPALQALSNMLTMSCIWFDMSNARAFFSHHDDGLAFDAFHNLAHEIAQVASNAILTTQPTQKKNESDEKKKFVQYNVVKYFAVAMHLNEYLGNSPVMMAAPGQVVAFLWIDPIAMTPEDEQNESNSDNIVAYDNALHAALVQSAVAEQGINPDFYMIGDRFAGIGPENDAAHGTTIFRKCNRLVLINEEVPFLVQTRKPDIVSSSTENLPFDRSTMHAFVVFLERVD